MATMENHHLVFMLEKLLPGSIPGTDYECITEYETDGTTVKTGAQIHSWSLSGVTQPSQTVLQNHWDTTYKAQHDTVVSNQATAEANRITSVVNDSLL